MSPLLVYCFVLIMSLAGTLRVDERSAILFEERNLTVKNVDWKIVGDFSDISARLKKAGIKTVKSLCVTGIWLLYPLPKFETNAKQPKVTLISGDKYCTELKSPLASMQPLGLSVHPFGEAISFFPKNSFNGKTVVAKESQESDFFVASVRQLGSLILTGNANWTLMDDQGKTVCLRTKVVERSKKWICLKRDFGGSKVVTSGATFSQLIRGCEGTANGEGDFATETFELTDCVEYGSNNGKLANAILPK